MQNITEPTLHKAKRSGGMKKALPKVDMTPMVDLGFLLITFFIFTAEISKPAVTDLYMPADGPPSTLGESGALSVMLPGNNTIFYFRGDFATALKNNAVFTTGFSGAGIRKVIRQIQQSLDARKKGERNNLMLLIKPGSESAYNELIKVLDEVLINQVKKYAIMELTEGEKKYMEQQLKK